MSILAGLVLIHSGLLAWAAYRDSFTWDEVGFLPAGISHWQFGNFDLFRVNPPLVRMIAAIPVLFADPVLDWSAYTDSIYVRSEIPIGETLLENNGQRAFLLLAFARWACIPFSLIGMLVCYRWARELFGDAAGLFAAGLWCFEPNIMGHGHLITPDVGATAFGVTAFFAFRRWLLQPNWKTTFIAGILFGFVQLTKTTWTVLYVAWPLIWLAWRLTGQRSEQAFSWRMQTLHLVAIFTIGLLVINSIYGFEGSFQRLDQYRFLSKTLGAKVRPGHEKKPEAGNRFAGTLLGRLPVPFPRNYIQGIDRQKHHFEKPDNSYLAGKWRDRGWYHYYIYAMYVKVPTGIWLLGYLSAVVAVGRRGYAAARRDETYRSKAFV